MVKQLTANTAGYDRVEEKIRNLKKAIQEGYESGICEDFDADSFLKQLKSEKGNG
ncbi:MAG: type II toxin-antitoxin system ParD family antitoxin [Bacteroidales bacterium]|nr:type II toxin-antitoxin system ParD family antitoxin [Bacteroidales bacterium]